MTYLGVDRTQPLPNGELLKQWTKELDEAMAKLRKETTCPNCGMCCMLLSASCDPRISTPAKDTDG